MAKGIVQFFREVRQESNKVTWPSRKEVTTTTAVVFVMVAIVAIVLLLADGIISTGIEFILGSGK